MSTCPSTSGGLLTSGGSVANLIGLAGTDLRGRFVLRTCIVNFRTEDDVNGLVEAIRRIGRRIAAQL